MKKIVSILLALTLGLSAIPAMAATDTNYTMAVTGTVLQNIPDRNITPQAGALDVNPVIEGESPTTGLPAGEQDRYMPMLVQISNPENKKPAYAGIGLRAPWGGQYADIVYEELLYRSGQTRLTFLINDAFSEGVDINVGPVRSARYGQVKLREEWQGGLVFVGGPDVKGDTPEETNSIFELFKELGANAKGVVLNAHDNAYAPYFSAAVFEGKTKDSTADNRNANVSALRSLIPSTTVAEEHPFLFADVCPYTDGYDLAYSINLDWGHKKYISHFYYDESENVYLRYCTDEPYMTFSDENRYEDSKEQMAFSNVIIQRITYTYAKNNKLYTQMDSVGQGNADIFIGGRYIPGYWVRESIDSPTVYLDDQGNEIQLSRGKTYIAQFPPESLLTYDGAN